MNYYSIAPFIKEYYPQYYTIETYPFDQCATIRKVREEWGILGNFAPTPLEVDGVRFRTSEQLFQLMKFTDAEALKAVYLANNPKMTAKHWEKTHRREDWGKTIVDAMKYCLMQKYEQNESFRTELARSNGLYIVEDQTSFPKKTPDTWGVKRHESVFVGPNLLGRLLMELRNNGRLSYQLPDDSLDFIQTLKKEVPIHGTTTLF